MPDMRRRVAVQTCPYSGLFNGRCQPKADARVEFFPFRNTPVIPVRNTHRIFLILGWFLT